ncbi:glycoside hydrolase family 3 C-terminal domain-containing protein [Novosphingobium rhizosphaerae]
MGMRFLSVMALAVAGAGMAHAQAAGNAAANPAPGGAPVDLAAADARAAQTVKALQADERTTLTHGIMAIQLFPNSPPIPADAVPGAGYIAGLPRLGIPALKETDASLGVAWVSGARKRGATALPSGIAQAASWDPAVLHDGGAMIGAEARASGFNVLLAGGVNLTRDPRNGRTFEYLSEDPLLSGVLVGAAIRGIQSNHIISTIKHFALNGQETGRQFVDIQIDNAAARESDLLAFQIGIEQGQPGSIMCAYNRVNGPRACASDWLLNSVLKRDWRYKGFVMSDWGAVPGIEAATAGLDQQSGEQLDKAVYFGSKLAEKAAGNKAWAARLEDMNRRVLTAIYATGVDQHPVTAGGTWDEAAHAAVAERAAIAGIVLLRNQNNALPLLRDARNVAVIGGYADGGVVSGGGSSQVQGDGGPVVARPVLASGPFAGIMQQQFHRSSPLDAIKARVPQAAVHFRDGRYIADAVEAARRADVAIVFATEWRTEGLDQPDLSLPDGQDALIAAVAAANPRTIVVLETGGPVAMPWLDKTAAVVEAWYPGARGGEAIAKVLFGEANPGGRLPVTFPASVDQLPRPKVDGSDTLDPDFMGTPPTPDATLKADYNIEGSDVGYRWFARKGAKPLFPFGYGLSYTTFASEGLSVDGKTARFTLRNTGKVAGDDVGQVYLVDRAGSPKRRLVGFARVHLEPGEAKTVSVPIDPRLLADWRDDTKGGAKSSGGWTMPAGSYGFALGSDAQTLGQVVTVRLPARNWKD